MPLRLGDITIHRLVEQELGFLDAFQFFPSLTPELLAENAWLKPRFIDAGNRVVLCVQSYLVRTPRHNILVDTCVGNDKPRARAVWNQMRSDRYERGFAALGLTFDDIDFVMCTHLHVDHAGWNTRLQDGRWVPTFRRARYLFSERELQHWTARHAADPQSCPVIGDSVLPVVEAGLADLVRSDLQFEEAVTLLPTPGHTIDHFSVRVGREGADAVITGDMVHSPLQVKYPEIGMFSDFDSRQAGETRRALFGRCCDAGTVLCTAHFPAPSRVRLERRGGSFACHEV